LAFARAEPRATVADETTWKGSGIGGRLRGGDGFLDDVAETMRDLRAMVPPFAEVTVLA
jgi:hypothetical protein